MFIEILSSSHILPEKVLDNADLEKMVDTSDEWITRMSGIKRRHVMGDTESFIDCTYRAAHLAAEKAGVDIQTIDLLIIGTSTPAQIMPSTASILQGMLGIENCISFDLQAACSGFVYALATAFYMMSANPCLKNALVMGCDAVSKVVDWSNRSTCVLFGDGFGAMLLGRNSSKSSSQNGILYCCLGGDGAAKSHLEVPWGIAQGKEVAEKTSPYIVMNGREVFKSSVNYFTAIIKDALEKADLTLDDTNWIIPHQANLRILQAVSEKLNAPFEKFIVTVDIHGNTSSATIPLAFDHMRSTGKIKKGDIVLMAGFGAGYTWGTVILKV